MSSAPARIVQGMGNAIHLPGSSAQVDRIMIRTACKAPGSPFPQAFPDLIAAEAQKSWSI